MLLNTIESNNGSDLIQNHVARLDIYSESIVATLYNADKISTFEVAPETLVELFGKVGFSTGILPPNSLFYVKRSGCERVAIWFSERVITVKYESENKGIIESSIPLPRMLFVGEKKSYGIFALPKEGVLGQDTPLFHSPFPNVKNNGQICFGNIEVPNASIETMIIASQLFFSTTFNGDLASGKSVKYPQNVIDLWGFINGKKKFPYRDLVPLDRACIRHLTDSSSSNAQQYRF